MTFSSSESYHVEGDTNNTSDVFVHDVAGNPLWPEAVDLGWGWSGSWFGPVFGDFQGGYFYQYPFGWLHVVGDDPSGSWFSGHRYGWLFTGEQLFPHLYSVRETSWLWYLPGSDPPRFFNYRTGGWVTY